MVELIQITNDPAIARRCDGMEGMRVMLDLERMGKAQRQAGRDTLISAHELADIPAVKAQLRRTRLMVRVNPLHAGTQAEVDAAIAGGAHLLMLPMFADAATLQAFLRIVDGRAGVVPLLETPGALSCIENWIALAGIDEIYLGLNDLHLALGLRFMFEPLASGIVDRVAQLAQRHRMRFGFGGIARAGEGLLPGEDVLAEHLRLGSGAVILSRTFQRSDAELEDGVERLRAAETKLERRGTHEVEADRRRIAERIAQIAARMAVRA